MNKKVNTLLFTLVATAVNVILMLGLLIGLVLLINGFLPEGSSDMTIQLLLIGAFLFSMAGTFVIYKLIITQITKRVDMEKYFQPLFKPRRRDGGNGRMLR